MSDIKKDKDLEAESGGTPGDLSFKRESVAHDGDSSEIDELLSFGSGKRVSDAEIDEIILSETAGRTKAPERSESEIDALMGMSVDDKETSGEKTKPSEDVEPGEKAVPAVSEKAPAEPAPRTAAAAMAYEDSPRPVRRPASAGTPKKKKKKKRRSYFNGSIFGGIILVTVILTVSLVLAVSGLSLGMEFYGINKSDNEISFNIPEDTTEEEMADLLIENGIIKNKKLFLTAVRFLKNDEDEIIPGDITLQASMTYSDIIKRMTSQRESYQTVTITFAEGEYLTEIAAKLEEEGVCTADDFIWVFNKDQGFSFESRLSDVDNTFYDREGYFFPDTYEFYVGKSDYAYNVTKIVREHFEEKITDEMYRKMDKAGLSLNEVITLASIVQHEAASVDEMPKVASVFLNRLDDPDTFPMLQSDTTSRYISNVIKKYAGNDESIQHYTEYYDTYSCVGLPAGPICNPGIEAIKAVLDPAKTKYYYFCNNLETGETFYAETLEEHEKNLIRAGLVEGELDEDDEKESKKSED